VHATRLACLAGHPLIKSGASMAVVLVAVGACGPPPRHSETIVERDPPRLRRWRENWPGWVADRPGQRAATYAGGPTRRCPRARPDSVRRDTA
jgi:hypothetical protein